MSVLKAQCEHMVIDMFGDCLKGNPSPYFIIQCTAKCAGFLGAKKNNQKQDGMWGICRNCQFAEDYGFISQLINVGQFPGFEVGQGQKKTVPLRPFLAFETGPSDVEIFMHTLNVSISFIHGLIPVFRHEPNFEKVQGGKSYFKTR